MRKLKQTALLMSLLLAVAGCASTPSACINPQPPPANLMQPPPDLMTPLNGIISVSGSESAPPQRKSSDSKSTSEPNAPAAE